MEAISDLANRVLAKLPTEPPANPVLTPEQVQATMKARREKIQLQLNFLLKQVGPRYAGCSLENYTIKHEEQKQAVNLLQKYLDNLRAEVKAGNGILLYGPTGTGKDHMLIGLARMAITTGCPITWVNGVELHAKMREAIRTDASEDSVLTGYKDVKVLILSDPLPPSGVLGDFQAATLYRLVDYRYRHLLPIWCSMNVSGIKEARERLGAATIDRLKDGVLAVDCKWETYRRAR